MAVEFRSHLTDAVHYQAPEGRVQELKAWLNDALEGKSSTVQRMRNAEVYSQYLECHN